MNEQYTLGNDSGTTNTTATIQRGSAPLQMLSLGTSSNAIPSSVLARDGGYLVDEEATRLSVLDLTAYERTPKRRLGHAAMLLGRTITEPVHLVVAALTRVLGTARSRSRGIDPDSVVITCPHAWAGHRLGELQRAVSALPVTANAVHCLTEPVATAYAHMGATSSGTGTRIAVADVGGGSFDVAVLESAGSSSGADPIEAYRIVGTGGMDPLGGDDFDVLLEDLARTRRRAERHERLAALLAATTARKAPPPAPAITLSRQPVYDAPPRLAATPSLLTGPIPKCSRRSTATSAPLSGPARRARSALPWFAVPCALSLVIAIGTAVLLALLVVSPGVKDSVLDTLAMLGGATLGMSALLLVTIVRDIDRTPAGQATHKSNEAAAL